MIKGIYHAAAGMIPRMNQLETVNNNLANANTTGFKADSRFFRTTLTNNLLQGSNTGGPTELNEEEFYLHTDFSQGSVMETRNPLNIAISGNGFFEIGSSDTNDSIGYTRNGNFHISENGELVNINNDPVLGEGGAIPVNGKEVRITQDGEVLVDGELVDKLKIVDFEQPYKLRRNGYGNFTPEGEQEAIIPENTKVMQGYLEESNVNPIEEMVKMIELNREFEFCHKAIQTQSETLKTGINEVGRPR